MFTNLVIMQHFRAFPLIPYFFLLLNTFASSISVCKVVTQIIGLVPKHISELLFCQMRENSKLHSSTQRQTEPHEHRQSEYCFMSQFTHKHCHSRVL